MNWINRKLLPIKAHYFLYNAGCAPVVSFMTVYAKQLGFSSVAVGSIYTVLPIVGMLSKLFIGALADRLRLRKALFLAFLALAIISFFGVQFVPPVNTSMNKVFLDCGAETNIKICSKQTEKKCVADHLASNKTTQCYLNCDLTLTFIQDLCHEWKVPEICSLTLPSPPTTNALPHNNEGGKTAYSKNNGLPNFSFIADVPLNHTVQIKDCVYLRVKTAVLTDVSTHIPYCNSTISTQCEMTCTDGQVNHILKNDTDVGTGVFGRYQFWLLFWLLVLSWIGMAVVVSLTDTICFELLEDKPSLFGQQRVWGAVGWGLLAILGGAMVDYFSEGEFEKNYTPAFCLLLLLWLADFICSCTLKYEQTKISKNVWTDVGHLLINPRIVIFMLSCVIMGMCTGLQWNFLYWYLEELASSEGCVIWIKTLQGLVSGVQCFLGELPYFFLSGYILQRLGHVHCMSLILFFVSIRLLLYSALTDPWWTLPIELFQGVYGLFYPTMASYANAVAPPGTEATVQGLVGAVFEGVGVALGSFLAGMSYRTFAGAMTFRIFGVGALMACFLHVGVQYILAKRVARYSPKGFTGIRGTESLAMLEVT